MIDVIRWDLLHGPADDRRTVAPDVSLADALDEVLTTWCATFVDDAHVPWAMPDRSLGFYRSWRALAAGDRRLAALVGRDVRERIDGAARRPGRDARPRTAKPRRRRGRPGRRDPHTPVAHAGMGRVRTLVRRLGAGGSRRGPAAHGRPRRGARRARPRRAGAPRVARRAGRGHRVDQPPGSTRPRRRSRSPRRPATTGRRSQTVVGRVSSMPTVRRSGSRAHESSFRDRLLARLDVPNGVETIASPTRGGRMRSWCSASTCDRKGSGVTSKGSATTRRSGSPGSSACRCGGVRSGSDTAQARCPVLVSPRHEIAEVAVDDDRAYLVGLLRDRWAPRRVPRRQGRHRLAVRARRVGRLVRRAGRRAVRTLAARPGPTSADEALVVAQAHLAHRGPNRSSTRPPATNCHAGLSLEERTLFAEAIVTTIGMSDFAPLVVLCGHGSHTTNNPHASSLDCGACGGAPGGASARIAVAILNDPDVRCRSRRTRDRDSCRHLVRRRRTRHDRRRRHDLRPRASSRPMPIHSSTHSSAIST